MDMVLRVYTEGVLGPKKRGRKEKLNEAKKKKIKKREETKIRVATSALLLFWQVYPRELPQWQNTE